MRPLPRSGNKYGAKRTVYNGQTYDSKREAARAAELDLLVKARELRGWFRPETIPLVVNGIKVCGYRPDFHVIRGDGDWWLEDVKGTIAAHSRIKMDLFRALNPGVVLKVIK